MYLVSSTKRFDKDYERLVKRGWDMSKLDRAFGLLAMGHKLPREYSDHELKGKYVGKRECHIGGPKSNWLLVYRKIESQLILELITTGSHQDLKIGEK